MPDMRYIYGEMASNDHYMTIYQNMDHYELYVDEKFYISEDKLVDLINDMEAFNKSESEDK